MPLGVVKLWSLASVNQVLVPLGAQDNSGCRTFGSGGKGCPWRDFRERCLTRHLLPLVWGGGSARGHAAVFRGMDKMLSVGSGWAGSIGLASGRSAFGLIGREWC